MCEGMRRNMNPIIKALSVAATFAVFCFAVMYIRSAFIEHVPFEPNWAIIGAAAGLCFIADLVNTWVRR